MVQAEAAAAHVRVVQLQQMGVQAELMAPAAEEPAETVAMAIPPLGVPVQMALL